MAVVELLDSPPVLSAWWYSWRAVAVLIGLWAFRFLYTGFKTRRRYRKLAAQGIPILPHSWLLGHLPIVEDCRREMPPDMNFIVFPQWLATNWKRYFPDRESMPPVIYFDMWPFFSSPTVIAFDVAPSTQFLQNRSLEKHPILVDFVKPLSDNRDLITSGGAYWKKWRAAINPGFNPRNLVAMIPHLIEEIEVFTDGIRKMVGENGAWGPMFLLEDRTTDLTLDVILRAATGKRLLEQTRTGDGRLKAALLNQITYMESGGDTARGFGHMPWDKYAISRNNRVLKEELEPELKKHLEIEYDDKQESTMLREALKSIQGGTAEKRGHLDPELYEDLICQLKSLVFAGYDTTASSLCWMVKLLQDNPQCLAKMRAEHDKVLGTNVDDAASVLKKSPNLLNALPYTQAVVKETLRLYPIAFAIRQGVPDYFLTVPGDPIRYPTDGCAIWDALSWMHRNPSIWPRADEFVPERWMVPAGDPLHPHKDTWRPFSIGHRVCIGQELAQIEAKLVAVMLARRFDIEEAWDKFDATQGGKNPQYKMFGQRAYPSGRGTMHPKDGMPCHVRLRKV